MSDGKITKTKLAEEIRELRQEVDRLRTHQAVHHAHGYYGTPQCYAIMSHTHCNWGHCYCWITHGYTYSSVVTSIGVNPYPTTTVTNGTVTSGGYTVTATNLDSGRRPI